MASLKLVYANDIRKVNIETISLQALHDKIKTVFTDLAALPFESLFIHYVDDEGDKIRIKFDIELLEAVRYSQGKSVVLKIFIQNSNPTSNTTSPARNTSNPLQMSDICNLAPFLGMLNNVAPMLLNNPAIQQQMASMLPAMMPLVNSILGPIQNISNMNISSSPTASSTNTGDSDDTFLASEYGSTSISTNTPVDVRDVSTETPICNVTQTTQTQQANSNTHQTTQTAQNTNSATQTAKGVSATQTTQTASGFSCATQTANGSSASQTTQTHSAQNTCETQTQSAQSTCETQTQSAQNTCETQTQSAQNTCETQTNDRQPSFYEALAGTKFGSLLCQLCELGFADKEKCLQALVKHGGKLPEAIDELLLDQLLD